MFRTGDSLNEALAEIRELQKRYRNVSVQDKGKLFNTDLLEAIELGFLLDIAEVTVVAALNRKESRGGHYREDFPDRDDANYMLHTMAYRRPTSAPPTPATATSRATSTTSRTSGTTRSSWGPSPSSRPGTSPWSGSTDDCCSREPCGPPASEPKAGAIPPASRSRSASGGTTPESEHGEESTWDDFTVQVHGTDRVLDALHKIKWEQDGSLTFRRSCAHGVCGSDAMRINGRNRLACKTLLKDVNPDKPITVEPIKGLPVVKDLVVDMEPFFASYREIMPFLITSGGNEPTRERLQSAEDRERFDDTTKCILCAACTSSCPVFWTDGQYFGPAAIVNAHRFIFDSRDEGATQRLEILNDKEGVWRCRTTFNCTEACPRGIEVTKAIQEVKRAMITRAF